MAGRSSMDRAACEGAKAACSGRATEWTKAPEVDIIGAIASMIAALLAGFEIMSVEEKRNIANLRLGQKKLQKCAAPSVILARPM